MRRTSSPQAGATYPVAREKREPSSERSMTTESSGLIWMLFLPGEVRSPVSRYLEPGVIEAIRSTLGALEGDLAILAADQPEPLHQLLGRLRVELVRCDPDALLKVSDTGVGISEANLSRVFEPFFTTKDDGDTVGEHVGLGLAVVHGIVKDLGGSILLTSEAGAGTTVMIRFPIVPPPKLRK